MNQRHFYPIASIGRQRGAVLMISLIFLIVLTLLGLTASQSAILEERMSGNTRDRSVAMQSAEMALRRAEQHVRARKMDLAGFTDECTDGLCSWMSPSSVWQGTTVAHRWDEVDEEDDAISYEETDLPYGAGNVTLAVDEDLPEGVVAPRYLIEGKEITSVCPVSECYVYRITVRAQGGNPNTVVWLQEAIYRNF